jgi:metal-responsive CopG/Arc/MetJ family transcriptional regulator
MHQSISVRIDPGLKYELDRMSKAEGVSRSSLVQQALRDHLAQRHIRALRRVLEGASNNSEIPRSEE